MLGNLSVADKMKVGPIPHRRLDGQLRHVGARFLGLNFALGEIIRPLSAFHCLSPSKPDPIP
jgi:hypothetical protein